MAIISSKEINKKLNAGLKQIKDAVRLARENVVVGKVTFTEPGKPAKKVVRTRKPRTRKTTVVEPPVAGSGVDA